MDKRTEDLMVEAVTTNHTCGEGCWYARERVCRCACGGKNHGCLLDGSAERPARTSRIDGAVYELAVVGTYADLYRAAQEALRAAAPKDVAPGGYKFYWSATEAGSPVRLRKASKVQLSSWKELAGADPRSYTLWRRAKNN